MPAGKKPYLVIPKLIEQPTWGGQYILQTKRWSTIPFLRDKKIGQSYELFGDSKLCFSITDSSDKRFGPEFGFADRPDTITDHFTLTKGTDYIDLKDLEKIPLLIKFTQAGGNSFQLHVKPGTQHPHWKPKPESWYYLEDGLVTIGVNKTKDINEYKKACELINDKMTELSKMIQGKELLLEEAKKQAARFVKQINPWQFVNVHEVKKFDLIDLSRGGIHHSWEENKDKFPLGNVLYEVQVDVMDPVSTLRSFDQGKLKEDGTIRKLTIDDYFTFLDTDPSHNDIENLYRKQEGSRLLTTPWYALDILNIDSPNVTQRADSFHHLYVREGAIIVEAKDGKVTVHQGHSCFVPSNTGVYTITNIDDSNKSVVLKTYI